jgi:hypothetical protein
VRRRGAWGALAAALGLTAVGLALAAVNGQTPKAYSLGSPVVDVISTLMFTAFPIVGALIALRAPGNAMGWLFLATGLVQGLELALLGYASRGLVAAPGSVPGAAHAALVADTVWVPVMLGGIAGLFLLFPHGRLPSRRWRPAVWLGAALALAYVGGTLVKPGPLYYFPSEDNPLAIDGAGAVARLAADGASTAAIGLALAGAVSLVSRFRRSSGQERQQFKWLALVAGLLLLATPVLIAANESELAGVKVSDLVFVTLISLVPVAVGIAILRHGLYDVDVVIRRTLVYAVLTATLGAAYLGSVLLVGLAVGESGLAVAVSTLAVAALFRPARARIQSTVDRRFYRRRYDAALTLEAFGGRLREELDLETLVHDVRGVVTETVQPTHVSVWLR